MSTQREVEGGRRFTLGHTYFNHTFGCTVDTGLDRTACYTATGDNDHPAVASG